MADSLETDYLQFNRDPEAAAGDRLLRKYGRDPFGQPLPAGEQAPAPETSREQRAAESKERVRKIQQIPIEEPSFFGDVVMGAAREVPRSILHGGRAGIVALNKSLEDLAGYISEKTGLPKGGALASQISKLPEVAQPETPGGRLLSGVSQFATGYATGGKALGAIGVAGKYVKPALAGLFSDVAAFDPDDPNVSNLLEGIGIKNQVTEFLATDPSDSKAVNRLRRGIEGLGLGVATDVVIGAARAWRAAKAVQRTEAAFEQAKQVKPSETANVSAAVEATPVSPANQVDVIQPPTAGQDIGLGLTGREGQMLGERLRLPAPGQHTLTLDEMAEQAMRERKAEAFMEGHPTLRAAEETMAFKEELRGNPTLRAAYETTLKGESEEAMVRGLVNKERETLESIIKSQKGEVSPAAVHALARASVGAAFGLTQGDTTEERIMNALTFGGIAAAIRPSLIKRLVSGMERAAPREMQIAKSFDPPLGPGAVTAKGVGRKVGTTPVEMASGEEAKAFIAANPDAIQAGDKALKINWDDVGSQADLNNVVKVVTDANAASIDVARRGKISDEKTKQLANMLGLGEEDLLRRRRGQAMNAEQTQGFIDVYGAAIKKTDELATALKNGEPVEAQFRAMLGRTTALTHEIYGARAEAGRALRIWGGAAQQIRRQQGLGRELDLLSISGKTTDNIPADRLADMILALRDPAQKATFLSQATQLGRSALLEAWINGLLTNPVTHAANSLSNALTTGIGVSERWMAEQIGRDVAKGEAAAMVHGITSGWRDALSTARRAFVEGESQLGFSKLETHGRAISAENFNLSGDFGKAVDLLGTVVTTPGRALLAADDFFKAINYRAELHAQAWRQATREGLPMNKLADRMKELVRDTDFVSIVKDQAEEFANYQTFTQQMGRFGTGYLELLDDHPALRVLLTPFVRTPVNIAKYTWERMPGLNLLSKQVQSDLAAGGVKRDLAQAKMAMGGLMFSLAGAFALGGFITGGGPRDKDLLAIKRAKGWQPYSFKLGNTYYSYQRAGDPVAAFFGTVANLVELSSELDEYTMGGAAMAGLLAFKETFVSKTFLQGVSNAFEALNSPDRSWQNYTEKLAGSVVPAGLAQIARMIDPTLKEVNGYYDAIMNRIPGYGGIPRRNIWGEKIQLEGALGPDIVSPFYTSTEIDDPVTDEILKLEASIAMPPRYIFGSRPSDSPFAAKDVSDGIRLTPEEYDRYVVLAGNELKLGGKGLHERLQDMMDSESYRAKSALIKKTLIERTVNAYQEAAEKKLLDEFPELKDELQLKTEARREALRNP